MWDLETQAQVGEQHTDGSALGLEAFSADGQFLISHTRRGLDVWQVQHLYKLRTVMGTAVTKMKVSGQHSHRRAICVCGDSAVRILAADTGDMISTLLLDKGSKVRAAEYCMYRESVFVLLEQGDLLKANALENPMSIVSRVKSNTTGTLPICLTLYTSILDEARALSEWRRIVEQRGDKKQSGKDVRLPKGKNSFFPITGGEDGTLCVLDWYTNQALYQLKAHSPESVTSLISSVQNHYVISAGSDLKVKVWRFSPDSKECLSPHMTFVCSQPIGLMCTMGSQLFVAIRDPSTANYSLVLYCLETQTKADHIPSDDHQDEITGLCSCSKLQLVATCGKDKMIQIWNEDNQLLRTLCLNSVPQSLAFSSNRGELLLGIHNHVYHIDLSKLLPTLYQLKIMCTEPSLLDKESQIPVPEEILISLSKYDKRRLTEPCSAFGNSIRPLTTIEENIKRQLENKEQSQEFVRLCARDQELNLIQNGMLRPNKKRKSNKEIRKEATKRYLQLLFREKPHMKFPAVDPFDPDGDQMTSTFLQPQESPFLPSVCNPGFFPKLALSETSLSFGFIPNSALLQFICPNDTMEQQHDLEKRFWTRIHKATFEDPVLVQSPELVISEKKEEVEKKEEKEDTGEWEESYDRQSILQKISQVEVRKKSVPIEDTSPVLSPPPTPVKPKKTTIAKLPRPVHSRRPLLRPQQSKLPVKSAETVQPDNPAPPISPQKEKTPSPIAKAPTPREPQELLLIPKEIPLFIRYFQDEDWFTLICPETKEEVQRLSDSEFESRLLQGILHSDLPMCRELLHALRMLHQHGHMEDPKETYQTLIRLMEKMNLQVPEEREFVFTCLSFMNDLFSGTKDLIVELLVTCVLVHPTQRAPLLVLLREMGLQDPHGILPREINSWDNWEMTERTKESLRQSWEEWIEDWTFQLKDFVSASLMSVQREASEEGSRARRHHIRGGRLRDKVRVTLEQIEATIDVTTIEVLNYFCEIQMAKDIQVEVPQHASTVLALPPIQSKRALLRLGETGKSFRRKDKDDVILPLIPQPLLPEIIQFINLPLKKVSLSPFPSRLDVTDSPHLIGSLNKEVHKYFIQQHSFSHSYY
ncbi:WD repeat-containing protein 97 [Discoglossus pictus]